RAVASRASRVAVGRRSIAAAARRADQHAVARPQDVLTPVVDGPAVDAHLAAPAGLASVQPGRGKLRALRHEADGDRARRLALHQDVLAESAAKAACAAGPRPQPPVAEDQRAVARGPPYRRGGDVA